MSLFASPTVRQLRADIEQADQDVIAAEAEASQWHRRAVDAEARLEQAGHQVAALQEQVEELSRCLAEASVEAEHMTRSFRAVCDERDEERAARKYLQQAGRDITAAFTSETRDAEPILDEIGRILIRHAHRLALDTTQEVGQ